MFRAAPIVLIGLTLAACRGESEDHTFDAFDSTIQTFLKDKGLAGATAIVVHRDSGVLHQRAYGSFDLDRVSLIASSSKIVTAGVLLRLDDQGLVDVEAPIGDSFPDWGERPIDFTVAQALSNSAGLVSLSANPTYSGYLCQYIPLGTVQECGMKIFAADDGEDVVLPDTEFRYGGGQWQVAGAVAEAATGKSWAQLIDETYVQPCGLDTFGYTNHYGENFVNVNGLDPYGYPGFMDGDLADVPITDNPNMEGGAYTTVADYGQILLMHLRGGECANGRVLSEDAVAWMQEDRIDQEYGGVTDQGGPLEGYGFGWWIDRDNPGVVTDGGAYGASPWIDNNRGYGVMVILEADFTLGGELRSVLHPVVDEIIDGME